MYSSKSLAIAKPNFNTYISQYKSSQKPHFKKGKIFWRNLKKEISGGSGENEQDLRKLVDLKEMGSRNRRGIGGAKTGFRLSAKPSSRIKLLSKTQVMPQTPKEAFKIRPGSLKGYE